MPCIGKNEYIERHNKVASYVHWNLSKHYDIDVSLKWYEHNPQTVVESQRVTILWDIPIHTDREIAANRPDIVVKDREDKKCYLIAITVPIDPAECRIEGIRKKNQI